MKFRPSVNICPIFRQRELRLSGENVKRRNSKNMSSSLKPRLPKDDSFDLLLSL